MDFEGRDFRLKIYYGFDATDSGGGRFFFEDLEVFELTEMFDVGAAADFSGEGGGFGGGFGMTDSSFRWNDRRGFFPVHDSINLNLIPVFVREEGEGALFFGFFRGHFKAGDREVGLDLFVYHFFDGGGIGDGQSGGIGGPGFDEFLAFKFSVLDDNVVDTHHFNLFKGFQAGAFSDGKHGYDRADSEDDAEHGQNRSHFMSSDSFKPDPYVFGDGHQSRTPGISGDFSPAEERLSRSRGFCGSTSRARSFCLKSPSMTT